MRKTGLILLRGGLTFVGTVAAALMTAMGQAGELVMPSEAAVLIAVLGGVAAAVAQIQSYLTTPPDH